MKKVAFGAGAILLLAIFEPATATEECIGYRGKECVTAKTAPIPRSTKLSSYAHYMPPREYDHMFKGGQTQVFYKSQADLRKICWLEKIHPDIFALGCSFVTANNDCIIALAPWKDIEARGFSVADTVRHEEAHCNGWPKHHPGGIVKNAKVKSARGVHD
jgi:hypothetical protein